MKRLCLSAVLAASLIWGCSRETGPLEISEIRHVPVEERTTPPEVSTAARLGLDPQGASSPHHAHMTMPAELGDGFDASLLCWHPPEGWQQGPDRPMRLATFIPESTTGTECAVSVLAGEAGGVPANVNRWRAQLELVPLTTAEFDELSVWPLLGTKATFLEIEGVLTSPASGASAPVTVYGLICPLPDHTLFVKMTGPTVEMAGERDRFEAFCRSIHFRKEHSE